MEVSKNRLPNAKEIWAGISKPVLARTTVTQSRTGLHTTRLLRGKNMDGKAIFFVETRSIFGMIDKFADLYTEKFDNSAEAHAFYYECKEQSQIEYDRLQKKQKERIENYGK